MLFSAEQVLKVKAVWLGI